MSLHSDNRQLIPWGYSGQHRSVSYWWSVHGTPHCLLFFKSGQLSSAYQEWWAFMNNAHIDSSAHMKMDSWPILTRLLETKKKRAALNPLSSLQSEGSGIIIPYCGSERGGELVLPSILNATALQSALTVKQVGATTLEHVVPFIDCRRGYRQCASEVVVVWIPLVSQSSDTGTDEPVWISVTLQNFLSFFLSHNYIWHICMCK